MKANALLHALISNREAEIEQLRADYDGKCLAYGEASDVVEKQLDEIERLRAALKDGWSTLALLNVNNYHHTLIALQAQLLAALEHKSPP
jgi:hypothetical protein